jgi:hypothetical protein
MEVGRCLYIVNVTFPTALGKSPTITLILPGVVANLHTSVVGLLSVAAKLPTLHRQILGPLSSDENGLYGVPIHLSQ